MTDLINSFCRFFFTVLVYGVCLITTITGMCCAAKHEKSPGSVKFLFTLALSIVLLLIGAVIFPYLSFSHSLWVLAAYTIWGSTGIIPFLWSLLKKQKKALTDCTASLFGIITVLIFCGSLSLLLYYECVSNGVFSADRLFAPDSPDVICRFVMMPVILFFTPAFAIFALALGWIREQFYGFIKNLLFLAAAPAGLIIFVIAVICQLNKIQSSQSNSIFEMFAAAVWGVFMILPYGFMLWRSKKEKDTVKFYNAVAGLGAVLSFLLGIVILGYIGRGV